MARFKITAECIPSPYPRAGVRCVYIDAATSDEAQEQFWTSCVAPLPKLRALGFIPIRIESVGSPNL